MYQKTYAEGSFDQCSLFSLYTCRLLHKLASYNLLKFSHSSEEVLKNHGLNLCRQAYRVSFGQLNSSLTSAFSHTSCI